MILSAGLIGTAVGVLAARPRSAGRLAALSPGREATQPDRTQAVHRAAFLAGAVALWWCLGGLLGLAAGLALLLLGPRAIARLDDDRSDDKELEVQLPLALDLLAACLAGGGALKDAVDAVAAALPGPCQSRLSRVSAALAVGSPPEEAFRALGDDRGPAGAAARALARSAQGGAPVAAAVAKVAVEARRSSAAQAERRARRAGVLAVGPLGACFLPAFVLLGIVPAVVGLAGPLLSRLT